MSKIILPVLVLVITQIFAQPVLLGDKSVQCYERDCPGGTTACKKVSKTSEDKKTLETIISCLDAQNMVLNEHIDSVPNPFGPSTTFQSTSYSGSYVSAGGQPVNINVNNDVGRPVIEDFS